MALATVIAEWAEPVLGLRRVFLFGSRVRGDHRPDSDVDLCIDRTNALAVIPQCRSQHYP